jgi:putative hydrolase of the HAD superfamily
MIQTTFRPEVIFFDYGHTLAADTSDHYGDIERYLRNHGIEVTRPEFETAWAAAEQYATEYREKHGTRKWQRDRFWFQTCKRFLDALTGEDCTGLAEEMHSVQFFTNTLYPDTIHTLRKLRERGYRLGVISNWDAPTLHSQFDRFGMTPYFDHILASWQAEADKPDPHIFITAMEALSIGPENAVHIGDSWRCDVEGARGVGITPVWVNEAGEPVPDGSDVLQIRERCDLLDIFV